MKALQDRGFATALARAAMLALLLPWSAAASANEQPFGTWLDGVRKEAAGRGIRPATLDAALAGIEPIPRVIELDRKQPEFTLTLEQYLARVVSDARIERGRQAMADNRALLDALAARYGVQPRFVAALWGIETDYGRVTGNYPVVAALATLAYDGRRATFFRRELMNALTILDQGHIRAADMKGSWAGAMGQNQFMPSSFLAYAVDHDGDGRRDIWQNRADVLASVANYLAKVGWRSDQTWGREALLPPGFDTSLISTSAWKTLPEWSRLGVRRADGGPLPEAAVEARLVRPNRDGTGPVFLAYRNYEATLKWNRSDYFAVAVGRLSDAIGQGD